MTLLFSYLNIFYYRKEEVGREGGEKYFSRACMHGGGEGELQWQWAHCHGQGGKEGDRRQTRTKLRKEEGGTPIGQQQQIQIERTGNIWRGEEEKGYVCMCDPFPPLFRLIWG